MKDVLYLAWRYLAYHRIKTVILVAHRLSTIERADRIIVLADGSVCESGTRDELLAKGGLYASMIRTKQEIEHAAIRPAASG